MLKRPYRIAVVIPKYGLVGGGERFAAEVTGRLADNPSYDIHVFATRWKVNTQNITFHRVPILTFPRFLVTPSFAYFANKMIDEMGFDLIHTHDRIFRADLFTMHGIPHRIWVSEVRRKRMSLFDLATAWVEEQMVRTGGCRLYLAVSKLARERFATMFPDADLKVELIPPGVAIDRFPVGSGREVIRRKVRARYGFNKSDSVILFVGMNFELKGLDLVMKSMAQLVAGNTENSRPKLLVVGKGDCRKYYHIARGMGIEKEIVFAGVVKEAVEELYLASDLFMLLSGFDTFGMVVLEAMAASLPVIVSDRVGAKDLVTEGVNGFVVDRDDVGAVCRHLRFLLNPLNRKRLGGAARRQAEMHSWDRVAARLEEIYQLLLCKSD